MRNSQGEFYVDFHYLLAFDIPEALFLVSNRLYQLCIVLEKVF